MTAVDALLDAESRCDARVVRDILDGVRKHVHAARAADRANGSAGRPVVGAAVLPEERTTTLRGAERAQDAR